MKELWKQNGQIFLLCVCVCVFVWGREAFCFRLIHTNKTGNMLSGKKPSQIGTLQEPDRLKV